MYSTVQSIYCGSYVVSTEGAYSVPNNTQSITHPPSCSTGRYQPIPAVRNFQAILDLETALVSSSPSTISSTSSVDRDAITPGNATSSWLRGFLEWLPSSSYTSEVTGSGDEEGLWVGTAELFNEAVNAYISEPAYQR